MSGSVENFVKNHKNVSFKGNSIKECLLSLDNTHLKKIFNTIFNFCTHENWVSFPLKKKKKAKLQILRTIHFLNGMVWQKSIWQTVSCLFSCHDFLSSG